MPEVLKFNIHGETHGKVLSGTQRGVVEERTSTLSGVENTHIPVTPGCHRGHWTSKLPAFCWTNKFNIRRDVSKVQYFIKTRMDRYGPETKS
jgi:hypothetical protein